MPLSSAPPALAAPWAEVPSDAPTRPVDQDHEALLGPSWQDAVRLVESIDMAAALLSTAGRVGYANAEATRRGLSWRDFVAMSTEQKPPWMGATESCSRGFQSQLCAPLRNGEPSGIQLTIPLRIGALRLELCVLASCPLRDRSAGALQKPLRSLAPRQARVARLMLRGLADKEIAAQLGLSYHTVRTYVRQVLGRFGVHSRGELISLVLREGAVGDASSST